MIIRTQGTQKESQIVEINQDNPKITPILHYDLDYDVTHPEDTIRQFCNDIQGMMERLTGNKDRVQRIDAELNDLEHYMETTAFKPVSQGYRLYRKLAELRKERRACKNEIELLQPIWEYFHATDVLNKLRTVQGECRKMKAQIDDRCYVCRTNVLEECAEPKKKPPEAKVVVEVIDAVPDVEEPDCEFDGELAGDIDGDAGIDLAMKCSEAAQKYSELVSTYAAYADVMAGVPAELIEN